MNVPVMKDAMFGKGGKPMPFDIPIPTSGVALFVDGKRVTLSTSAAVALSRAVAKAAEERDKETHRKGVPVEVRHWRD